MIVQENLALRINHDKFLVLFRNAELVSLAEQRVGKASAQVYREFLKRIEPKIFRCRNNAGEDEDTIDDEAPQKSKLSRCLVWNSLGELTRYSDIKLSCLELSRNFDPDIDLEGSIALPPKETKAKPRKRSYEDSDDEMSRRNGDGKMNGKRYHDSDDEGDEESDEIDEWAENDEDMDSEAKSRKNRMKLIKQHLMLLAEDSFRFLTSEGNRGMGEWSVNYKELGKTMRSIELERIVEERFESIGTRLLRIIKDKGKLDEKQVNAPCPTPRSSTKDRRLPISRFSDKTKSVQSSRECKNVDILSYRRFRDRYLLRLIGHTFYGTLTSNELMRFCSRTSTKR